jgi:hypothetical protein
MPERTLAELTWVPWRDMTKAERKSVVKAACDQLKRELESPEVRAALKEALK